MPMLLGLCNTHSNTSAKMPHMIYAFGWVLV